MTVLKVLGWIFVPFVMIFVQWKRLNKPLRVVGGIWALLVVIIGVSNASQSNSTQPTNAPVASTNSKPSSTSQHKPKPKQPPVQHKQSPTQQLISDVKQSKSDMIEKVEVNSYLGDNTKYKGGSIVDVYLKASDGFSTNGSMSASLSNVKDIAQAIFQNHRNIEEAAFWVDADLVDKYGNTTHDLWFRVVLNGDDGYKINWNGIMQNQFDNLLQWQWGTVEASQAFQNVVSSN